MAAHKKKGTRMILSAHTLGYTLAQCIDRADTLGQQLAMDSFEYSRWAEVAWNRPLSGYEGAGKCLLITAEGANADECIDRYRAQVDMLKSGCMDVIDGCTVKINHGDGGGP